MVNKPEFFWAPQGPGEMIVSMVQYQDMIVVATSDGIYVIRERGRGLDDHEVRKISLQVVTPPAP